MDKKSERELKRRVQHDFKHFGLYKEQNGNGIYGQRDLQEKKESRVQFQHFSHNVAITNICDSHATG